MDMLSEVMARFEGEGSALKLTAASYGSLIKAYGQAGDIKRVWALWQQMRQQDIKTTSVTLGCLVDALVKNRSVEDALHLVHEVIADEETRGLVNTVIYSTILKGFSKAGKLEEVYRVFAEMAEHA